MNEHEVRGLYAMPGDRPAYNRPPVKFVNREFLNITYRTDPDALARVIPAPLKVAEPIVKYEFIRMPDASGLGDYTESGQVVPVTLNGEAGGYTARLYLDSVPGILSGREILGYPKAFGKPKLEVRDDCLVGTLDHSGVRIATATMAYKYAELDKNAIKKSLEAPGFLLKIVPNADGSPRICELIKFYVDDITVKGAWSGPASLELHPHALAPVATLPVLEIVSATHIVADLALNAGEIAHDYLATKSTKVA